jgi:hypothetical protein
MFVCLAHSSGKHANPRQQYAAFPQFVSNVIEAIL